jgi:uncharacterized membrane protein YdjX (TVP38/TMEM64 family)
MAINHQTESNRLGMRRCLLVTCLLLLVIGGGAWLWHAGFLSELLDKDRLIAALRKEGPAGPLLCIAAQFVQVVIFAIPGEITQFAAGYVYGAWRGFLYSIIGIMTGSAFNFYFARIVGRPTLEHFISRGTLDKVDHALNSAKGESALFLLFLLPGAPKDAMCYGAGFTAMSLPEFVVITGLARTPALLASILIGAQASHKDYRSMILIASVVLVVILGYYFYERYRNRLADRPASNSDRPSR